MRTTLVYPAKGDQEREASESAGEALEEGYNPIRRSAEIVSSDAALKDAPLKGTHSCQIPGVWGCVIWWR